MHCFYWTPSTLFRLGLKDTPYCWRCKAEDGNLAHALWFCTKIHDFWERVLHGLDIHVSLCPRLFILGGWTNNKIGDKGKIGLVEFDLEKFS